MKIVIGTFAHNGISTSLGPDIAAAVKAALADFSGSLDSGSPPVELPGWLADSKGARAVELSVDERTLEVLEREADRQGTTVDRLAAHSVLVYLAEFDRLSSADDVAVL